MRSLSSTGIVTAEPGWRTIERWISNPSGSTATSSATVNNLFLSSSFEETIFIRSGCINLLQSRRAFSPVPDERAGLRRSNANRFDGDRQENRSAGDRIVGIEL